MFHKSSTLSFSPDLPNFAEGLVVDDLATKNSAYQDISQAFPENYIRTRRNLTVARIAKSHLHLWLIPVPGSTCMLLHQALQDHKGGRYLAKLPQIEGFQVTISTFTDNHATWTNCWLSSWLDCKLNDYFLPQRHAWDPSPDNFHCIQTPRPSKALRWHAGPTNVQSVNCTTLGGNNRIPGRLPPHLATPWNSSAVEVANLTKQSKTRKFQ